MNTTDKHCCNCQHYDGLTETVAIHRIQNPPYNETTYPGFPTYRLVYFSPPTGTTTPTLCPRCHGSGTLSRPPHLPVDQETWTDSSAGPYQCNVCSGQGTIWSCKQ